MKITQILFAALLLLLSACSDSTNTNDSFPTEAKDFMLAGNPGTELVMTDTYIQTDTTGKEYGPEVMTSVWTIMERDAPHPVGGKSLRVRVESRKLNSNPNITDSMYISTFDNSIMRFLSIKDTNVIPLLKNPIVVGAQYKVRNATATIKSVGEVINTTYKPLKTVLVEVVDTVVSTSSQTKTVYTHRFYFAPGMFVVRYEEIRLKIYQDNHTSKETFIDDLIQYTKK